MRCDKIFFSPQPTTQLNKYTHNFYETLAKNALVVNYNKRAFSQSSDMLRYSFSSNVMILNWPEDILFLKFGILQFIIAISSLSFFKLRGGKIIWVCHNKASHNKTIKWLSRLNRAFYVFVADYIIVHSKDAKEHFIKHKEKVHFLNHPVYEKLNNLQDKTAAVKIDVLIWGNIIPYKGLSEFISNYKNLNATFHTKIIGKADKKFFKLLEKQASGLNITLEDRFLEEKELETLFYNTKIILLPYSHSDTFSSGALIHSLNSKKIIIGPELGNFIDLATWNACLTYSNYQDLFLMMENLLKDQELYQKKLYYLQEGIEKYYKSNSWSNFIKHLLDITKGNLSK